MLITRFLYLHKTEKSYSFAVGDSRNVNGTTHDQIYNVVTSTPILIPPNCCFLTILTILKS